MDHSVPMLANFEALPEMLTAKDLEGLLQIEPQDDLCVRAEGTDPALADRIERPLLQAPGPALAGRAQLPAPTGEWQRRQAPMKDSAAGKTDTGSRHK